MVKIYQNDRKIYQIDTIYTKLTQYIQNCIFYCQPLPSQDHSKFTQIVIFGVKIYHLAALTCTRAVPICNVLSRAFLLQKKLLFVFVCQILALGVSKQQTVDVQLSVRVFDIFLLLLDLSKMAANIFSMWIGIATE
jgi:hypothetical protein